MTYAVADIVLVPYGVDHWSMTAVTMTGFCGRALDLDAPFPVIAVNRASGDPLRFNSQPLDVGTAVPDRDALRQRLVALCRMWDQPARDFIDGYFRHLDRVLSANSPALERRIAPLAGFFRLQDWLFSAPLPLPRAHLFAPAEPASPVVTEHDFVQVDFGFWLGDRFSAAVSAGRLSPARARERHARLARAGVTTVTFGAGDLGSAADALFERVACTRAAFARPGRLPTGLLRRRATGA